MKGGYKMFCKYCPSSKVINYGKSGTGAPRYMCKSCGRTFILESDKKKPKYTSKEKAFLSMLMSFFTFVQGENKNLDMHEIINSLDENKSDLYKPIIVEKEIEGEQFKCYQPRILICKDNNEIKIYRFKCRQSRSCKSRKITLIDDDKYSNKYKK